MAKEHAPPIPFYFPSGVLEHTHDSCTDGCNGHVATFKLTEDPIDANNSS